MANSKSLRDSIYQETLSNGLRCVHRQTDSRVAYCGAVVNAGSRDEADSVYGLAHFVEHTVFKGTKTRKSWQISNRLETIGGELNAYTSKEETMIFSNCPASYYGRAMELISDIITDSIFPDTEINREREVIIEEIKMYEDTPSDAVHDEFEDHIYAGSGLGHPILGTPESVRKINSSDCRGFLDRFYVPANMVVFSSGPMSGKEAIADISKYFSRLHFSYAGNTRTEPIASAKFDIMRERDGHQAHTVMGTRLFGRKDPRRFTLFLLNNILGGPNMSSRFNRELREKRGLVYAVDSHVALMSDCGVWQVYFGADKSHVSKCKKIITREIEKVASALISPRTLLAAKRQYTGQMLVAGDNYESINMTMGKSLLYFNEVFDIEWNNKQIMSVTPEEVKEMAGLILEGGLSSYTLC